MVRGKPRQPLWLCSIPAGFCSDCLSFLGSFYPISSCASALLSAQPFQTATLHPPCCVHPELTVPSRSLCLFLQAILNNMRVECKCHGVSGSCEFKTCWKAMPPFRKVGNVLKEKFDGATEVEQSEIGSTKVLVPKNSQFKPHTDEDLVYLDSSPDFCDHDLKNGVLGTSGRQCNKTSKAIDGCELMCCGRGFHTDEVEVVERCSCKFHWCCSVKCKPCHRVVEIHTCR